MNDIKTKDEYEVKVYVDHGYFSYKVGNMSQALSHAHTIMQSGVYRRSCGGSEVELYKVIKVKVAGAGLTSEYLDEFKRT